jgi:hypothetical protein
MDHADLRCALALEHPYPDTLSPIMLPLLFPVRWKDPKNYLRPEVVESLFILWRATGHQVSQ